MKRSRRIQQYSYSEPLWTKILEPKHFIPITLLNTDLLIHLLGSTSWKSSASPLPSPQRQKQERKQRTRQSISFWAPYECLPKIKTKSLNYARFLTGQRGCRTETESNVSVSRPFMAAVKRGVNGKMAGEYFFFSYVSGLAFVAKFFIIFMMLSTRWTYDRYLNDTCILFWSYSVESIRNLKNKFFFSYKDISVCLCFLI